MTSASVPALPVDVWSHVAQFLPVRDRVALLDASVSTREAVLRATKRRISDFLDGREHFFHHPGGAPCVDVPRDDAFPGVALDESIELWERPYCAYDTTIGPWWPQMLLPTLVRAVPASSNFFSSLFSSF